MRNAPGRRLVLIALACACSEQDRSVVGHPDTLSGLAVDVARGDDSLTPARPTEVRRPGSAADTVPILATEAELDALSTSLAIPVEGVRAADLRDSYAERRGTRAHEALDIAAPRGTAVLSATDGRLLKRFTSAAGGIMVYAADAGDRFILMYGHLETYAAGLTDGMPLRRGQLLGYVGTSGNAPANSPHLHFAVARGRPSVAWWLGTPVNPYPLLTRREPPRLR